jgi:uncharacterized protein (TIGR00730 family)
MATPLTNNGSNGYPTGYANGHVNGKAKGKGNGQDADDVERGRFAAKNAQARWREPSRSPPPEPEEDWVKPHKAYKNPEFLASKDARMIRIFCEMEESHARLQREGVENVIMVFGSARAMNREEFDKKAAKLSDDATPEGEQARERLKKQEFLIKYHEEVTKFGRLFSAWAQEYEKKHPGYSILLGTGGGPGMMEAANKGAYMAGNPSLGFGISVPFEPGLNKYVTPSLAFEYHYFFTRKFWMSAKCKGLVVAPGGLGTCDELFEFLTLMQTGKIKDKIPVVLLGKQFWPKVFNLQSLVDFGMISESDRDAVHIVDTAEEAMDIITAGTERILVQTGESTGVR